MFCCMFYFTCDRSLRNRNEQEQEEVESALQGASFLFMSNGTACRVKDKFSA